MTYEEGREEGREDVRALFERALDAAGKTSAGTKADMATRANWAARGYTSEEGILPADWSKPDFERGYVEGFEDARTAALAALAPEANAQAAKA